MDKFPKLALKVEDDCPEGFKNRLKTFFTGYKILNETLIKGKVAIRVVPQCITSCLV